MKKLLTGAVVLGTGLVPAAHASATSITSPPCTVALATTAHSAFAEPRLGCPDARSYIFTVNEITPGGTQVRFARTNEPPWVLPLPGCGGWQIDFASLEPVPGHTHLNGRGNYYIGGEKGAGVECTVPVTTTTLPPVTTTVPSPPTTVISHPVVGKVPPSSPDLSPVAPVAPIPTAIPAPVRGTLGTPCGCTG